MSECTPRKRMYVCIFYYGHAPLGAVTKSQLNTSCRQSTSSSSEANCESRVSIAQRDALAEARKVEARSVIG
jgi:hypothetical protein